MPLSLGHDDVHQDDVRLVLDAPRRSPRAPLPASPTTSMSSSASSSSRSPDRTTAWSSTIRTRIARSPSAPRRRSSSPRPARLDLEPAAERARPARASRRARAAVAAVARPAKPAAVVLDHGDDATRPCACSTTLTCRAPRVLDDVRQRLLHDPVERRLDLAAAAAASPSRASSVDVDARLLARTSSTSRSSAGTSPKSSSAVGRSSTASRRTSWSVATTSSRSSASASRRSSSSRVLERSRPSRIDVSAWPVSSWSSRASRRRSSSCASTTRRSASRLTRSDRSTATAARGGEASRRAAGRRRVKRGSAPRLSCAARTPIGAVARDERDAEPGRRAAAAARAPGRPPGRRAASRRARCGARSSTRAALRRAEREPQPDQLLGRLAARGRLDAQRRRASGSAISDDARVDELAQPRRRSARAGAARSISRRERVADLVQRLELPQPARRRLVEACVLDRDRGLRGEQRDELLVLVA